MDFKLSQLTVSYLVKITSKNPISVGFKEKILQLYNDDKHIDKVKKLHSIDDKKERTEYKLKHLPAFNPGGILDGGSASGNLTTKNPCVLIDIDLDSEHAALDVKNKLIKHLGCFAFFIGLSPSGKGVHYLLKGSSVKNMDAHKNSFDMFLKEFFNIQNDEKSTGVFLRKMYVGLDTSPFFNENPDPWLLLLEKDKFIYPKEGKEKLITQNPDLPFELAKKVFNNCDELNLADLIVFFSQNLGQDNLQLINLVDKKTEYSHLKECIEKAVTLNKSLKKNEKENTDKKIKVSKTEVFINEAYQFRFNTIKGDVEIKSEYGGDEYPEFVAVGDYILNSLKRKLKNQCDINISADNLYRLLQSDFSKLYNPIEEYFNNLDNWDNVDRIDEIISSVKLKSQEEYDFFSTALKKWLVGLVACSLDAKVANNLCLVLTGEQGVGKTKWFESLVPENLSNYVYVGIINVNNKDSLTMLAESFLVIMDEMSVMSVKDFDSFKDLTSRLNIKIRRPYARTTETLIRRASFCGTNNLDRFLIDLTGSRRFLTFAVELLNFKHNVDLNQLYAQVLNLYKSNFKYWMDINEIKKVEQNNENYQSVTAEEEMILKYFMPPSKKCPPNAKMTATDIVNYIMRGEEKGVPLRPVIAGKVLMKHKFKKIKSNGQQLYEVHKIIEIPYY